MILELTEQIEVAHTLGRGAPTFNRNRTHFGCPTTATKRNLGKVTRRLTLATHECDYLNP